MDGPVRLQRRVGIGQRARKEINRFARLRISDAVNDQNKMIMLLARRTHRGGILPRKPASREDEFGWRRAAGCRKDFPLFLPACPGET